MLIYSFRPKCIQRRCNASFVSRVWKNSFHTFLMKEVQTHIVLNIQLDVIVTERLCIYLNSYFQKGWSQAIYSFSAVWIIQRYGNCSHIFLKTCLQKVSRLYRNRLRFPHCGIPHTPWSVTHGDSNARSWRWPERREACRRRSILADRSSWRSASCRTRPLSPSWWRRHSAVLRRGRTSLAHSAAGGTFQSPGGSSRKSNRPLPTSLPVGGRERKFSAGKYKTRPS